jgi:hypothetical protein
LCPSLKIYEMERSSKGATAGLSFCKIQYVILSSKEGY